MLPLEYPNSLMEPLHMTRVGSSPTDFSEFKRHTPKNTPDEVPTFFLLLGFFPTSSTPKSLIYKDFLETDKHPPKR